MSKGPEGLGFTKRLLEELVFAVELSLSRECSIFPVKRALKKVALKLFSEEENDILVLIQAIRKKLARTDKRVTIMDYGAGKPDLYLSQDAMKLGRKVEINIGRASRTSSTSEKCGRFLFALLREVKSNECLELGAGFGISGLYLLGALELNNRGRLHTLEGSELLLNIARRNFQGFGINRVVTVLGNFCNTLTDTLSKVESVDFTFVDGHHDEHATKVYFSKIFPKTRAGGIIVFDDINWSEGMVRAWKSIKNAPGVAFSFDFHQFGLVIKRGRNQGDIPGRHFKSGGLLFLFG